MYNPLHRNPDNSTKLSPKRSGLKAVAEEYPGSKGGVKTDKAVLRLVIRTTRRRASKPQVSSHDSDEVPVWSFSSRGSTAASTP